MSSRPIAPAREPARNGAGALLPVRRWPERRAIVLTMAIVLLAATVMLHATSSGVAWTLAVVPIALCALELGLIGGLAVASIAFVLVAALGHGDATELVSQAAAFLGVAGLAGRFSDRMREATGRQGRLLQSGLTLAHLTNESDLAATVAGRARSAFDAKGARVELANGRSGRIGTIGTEPIIVPIELGGVRYGSLAIEPSRPFEPDDRAALTMIALQAGVACENQALLDSERERAALQAQLGEAHHRLSERGDQLREVLADQESERRDVAHRLHEEAAQALAATLLRLSALERDLGSDAAAAHLSALRADVDSTLVDLRGLAVRLRPPVLDLGLDVALRRLADTVGDRGLQRMEVALGDRDGGLSSEVATMVYRIVQEMLDAFRTPQSAAVRARDDELRVTVSGREGDRPHAGRLATIRARVELLRGEVEAADAVLRVRVPVKA